MTDKVHLYKFDVARGFAILLVFVGHAALYYFGEGYRNINYFNGVISTAGVSKTLLLFNFSPIGLGWCGVELFLVISGFLIHYSHLTSTKPFNYGSFMNRRFWRIVPPYYLVLIFFAFFYAATRIKLSNTNDIFDFVAHALLLHNLSDTTFFTINGVFWSLALEFQLYLIYPILLFLRKQWGMRNAFLFTIVLFLGLTTAMMLFGVDDQWISKSVGRFWFMWALGAFMAENYLAGKRTFKITTWVYVLLIAFFVVFKAFELYNVAKEFIVTFILAIGLEKYLLSKQPLRSPDRMLAAIGICSYSIYLIHMPLQWMLFDNISFFNLSKVIASAAFFLDCTLVFGITYLISRSMYKLIELPSIEYGKQLVKRRASVWATGEVEEI